MGDEDEREKAGRTYVAGRRSAAHVHNRRARQAVRLRDAVFFGGVVFAVLFFAAVFFVPCVDFAVFAVDFFAAAVVFFAAVFFAVDVDFLPVVCFGVARADLRAGRRRTSAPSGADSGSSPRDSLAAFTLFSSAAIRSSTLPPRAGSGASGGASPAAFAATTSSKASRYSS